MSNFLSQLLGYVGAILIVIGLAYYLSITIEISWEIVEIIGYLILVSLLALPFLRYSISFPISKEQLHLTTFLAVICLPVLLIITLRLHFPKGDNIELAGSFVCLTTSIVSLFYGFLVDSNTVKLYAALHVWLTSQFLTFLAIKEDRRQEYYDNRFTFEDYLTISSVMSLFYMCLAGYLLLQNQGDNNNKVLQNALLLGMSAYMFVGTIRCTFSLNLLDLVLIGSIIGIYYVCNSDFLNSLNIDSINFRYIEIPLNFLTAFYVLSKFYYIWVKANLPITFILIGGTLYTISLISSRK